MTFAPAIHKDQFSTFWSCGTGWGSYRQNASGVSLQLDFGRLHIRELSLGRGKGRVAETVLLNEKPIEFTWDGSTGTCVFKEVVLLNPNEKITIYLN